MARVAKREGALKAKLLERVRLRLPKFVAFAHQDVQTAGIADVSLTGNKLTSWWEAKHGTPDFDSPGIQELRCMQLAINGFCCRYIIWHEDKDVQRTLIVHPSDVHYRPDWKFVGNAERECFGFNHDFVVDYMAHVHGVAA